jgi:hypothetical protein
MGSSSAIARNVQFVSDARLTSQVGHIAAEFERLANVLLGRGCGNPALITYPHDAAFEFLDSVDFSSLHPLDTMKLRNKDQNVISRHC